MPAEADRPEHRDELQEAGEQGEKQRERQMQDERDGEPGEHGRGGDDAEEADEIAPQHRVDPRRDLGHLVAVFGRHEPEDSGRELGPGGEEIIDENDDQDERREPGEAVERHRKPLLRLDETAEHRFRHLGRERAGLVMLAEEVELFAAEQLDEEFVQELRRIAQRPRHLALERRHRPIREAAKERHDRGKNNARRRHARHSPRALQPPDQGIGDISDRRRRQERQDGKPDHIEEGERHADGDGDRPFIDWGTPLGRSGTAFLDRHGAGRLAPGWIAAPFQCGWAGAASAAAPP